MQKVLSPNNGLVFLGELGPAFVAPPVHHILRLSRLDFIDILKFICPNCNMYLSKLRNVFVQIVNCICPNCKMYLYWRNKFVAPTTQCTLYSQVQPLWYQRCYNVFLMPLLIFIHCFLFLFLVHFCVFLGKAWPWSVATIVLLRVKTDVKHQLTNQSEVTTQNENFNLRKITTPKMGDIMLKDLSCLKLMDW